ncbi:MAG: zinc ribbon domain-containing protein [Kofleriaceae bacterium]|nr:zinc ribbon domain-containing protein [Myxococcales bacterium]MCB9572166.1 zinc ribbon domain-containing protein [Kofleriaceae bacterium]
MVSPLVCPTCGVAVPPRATACPGCGSDEATGWSPAASYAHTLPEAAARPGRRTRRAVATALVTLVAFVAFVVPHGGLGNGVWIGAVAIMLVVAWWGWRQPGGEPLLPARDRFERLVAQCHGDRALAERLVAGEARRFPDRPRRELVDRAIERLRDDRGR